MTNRSSTRPEPARRALRHLLRILVRQPLWAIPFAIFFGTLFSDRLLGYWLAYQISLVFAYCIGLTLWAVEHFVVPRVCDDDTVDPDAPERFRIGLFYLGGALLSSYLASFIVHFTLLPGFMGSLRAVAISGMFALLFVTLFGGINFAIMYYRQAVERARAVEQIRAELAEAELRALRAQIRPHFLFNTLNTIASLVTTQPSAAEDLTLRLADMFRYTLRASEREHARFGDELEFLRAYLAIERARFGDRLHIEEEIEPGLESVRVPSLLLQPLVENAVQHGVAPRAEGGRVRITARREGDRLVVAIADDGPGMDGRPASGNGFGLRSVRERLRAAGLGEGLAIDSTPERGTTIWIRIPFDTTPLPNPTPGGDRP